MTALAGCDLYFGKSADDVCPLGVSSPEPAISLRDPTTGVCNPVSFDCGCGPCGIDLPNEPQCNGICEGLDETSCLATSACHAAYTAGLDRAPAQFAACWDIQPVTPVEGGDCTSFDAFTCASHDDCVSMFGTDRFSGCGFEPTLTCATVDCGPTAHCEDQCAPCPPTGSCTTACTPVCVPDPSCGAVQCPDGQTCVIACDASCGDGTGGACYPTCVSTGACESLTTESECTARPDCVPVYDGMDCTCDASGACTCASETFARCTTGGKL